MVNAGLEKVGGQFQGVDINYKNIISQSWHNNPWQSPITFVHDYILTGGVAEDSGMTSTPAKVRVSFTFYSLMATSADRGVSSNSYYWQCLIRVMDVIDRGNGYQNGMEFDLFWPPVRATAGEKTNRTPYFLTIGMVSNTQSKIFLLIMRKQRMSIDILRKQSIRSHT